MKMNNVSKDRVNAALGAADAAFEAGKGVYKQMEAAVAASDKVAKAERKEAKANRGFP